MTTILVNRLERCPLVGVTEILAGPHDGEQLVFLEICPRIRFALTAREASKLARLLREGCRAIRQGASHED